MPLLNDELAWAAGLFEGEGFFTVRRDKRRDTPCRMAYAGINMTDHEVLVRFADVVGVGRIYGPYSGGPKSCHRDYWSWRVERGEEFRRIVHLLMPWLCDRRLTQAASALAEDTRKIFNEPLAK